MIETIRTITLITATGIAAYTDYKTGYIYDTITKPLILIGAILNIIENNYYAFLLPIIIYLIGYLLYKTGKIGGGDVNLYTGIAMIMPSENNSFIINSILFATITAITYVSTYYTIKYAQKGIEIEINKDNIKKAIILGTLITAYTIIAIITPTNNTIKTIAQITYIPLILGCIYIALEKGIKKEFFLKEIKTSEAEEDEIIAKEFIDKKTMDKTKNLLKEVMQPKEIKELEKIGIKKILVYRDLPKFGPFIFIGTIIALTMPII
ncbi:MAG: A24 family peptidase [Candidatus Diapherotrites archaeon]